jgi:hypothetical protein
MDSDGQAPAKSSGAKAQSAISPDAIRKSANGWIAKGSGGDSLHSSR